MKLVLVSAVVTVAVCACGAAYASFDVVEAEDFPHMFVPDGRALQGDEEDDRFRGTADSDLVRGGGGADVLRGGASHDHIEGQGGPDVIAGEAGPDSQCGKAKHGCIGSPTENVNPAASEHTRRGYCLYGGAGADQVSGGTGDDYAEGQSGADVVSGGPQDDWVIGGPGADELKGGVGDDLVSGGRGDDTLIDLEGGNYLKCGPGVDRVTTNGETRVGGGCEFVTVL